MKSTPKYTLGLLCLVLSLTAAFAATPRLTALHVQTATGELIEKFDPEKFVYNIDVEHQGVVSISASPADARSVVSIYSDDGTVAPNHSVLTPAGMTSTYVVNVANAEGSKDYTVNITAAPSLTGDHRQLSIYQIMVHAYMHGEDGAPGFSEAWGPDNVRADGNLRGIYNSLEYIKSMGFNAIWMTPIFDCSDAAGSEKDHSHAYYCSDYFNVDPHFGTNDEFKQLVDRAHALGIYIILDGVFGHHGGAGLGDFEKGGVIHPSPTGNTVEVPDHDPCIYPLPSMPCNVAYPGSLPFYKEVVRYWIDQYGVDGWRLDQSYQMTQNGHNYIKELREEMEAVCAERRARGEKWGTLAYMVSEDWNYPSQIVSTHDGGTRSTFDFQGRDLLVDINNSVNNIKTLYSDPTIRGYDSGVIPNLFVGNHDMVRVANVVSGTYNQYGLTYLYTALAAYSGPVTFLYNDEFSEPNGSPGTNGSDTRIPGHTTPTDSRQAWIQDFTHRLFNIRQENPAMWRGTCSFRQKGYDLLEVTKTDAETGNVIVILFPNSDTQWTLEQEGVDLLTGQKVSGTLKLNSKGPMIIKVR